MRRILACLVLAVVAAPLIAQSFVDASLRQIDKDASRRGAATHEELMERLRMVRDEGIAAGDDATQARALIRMAWLNLVQSKWTPDWEDWRDEAVARVRDLESPSLARAEVLAHRGYLVGTYQHDFDAGISDLERAAAIGQSLENDYFLARTLRWLSRILCFDGQLYNSLSACKRSALIAKSAGHKFEELYAIESMVRNYRRVGLDVPEIRARGDELLRELAIAKKFASTKKELVAKSLTRVKDVEKLLARPPSERTQEMADALSASIVLTSHFEELGDWSGLERYTDYSERLAERLGDAMSMRTLRYARAVSMLRGGDLEAALKHLEVLLAFQREQKNVLALRRLCRDFGQHLRAMGYDAEAVKMFHEASTLNRWNGLKASIDAAAESYVKMVREERRLNHALRDREGALFQARFLLALLPLLGIVFYLWQRGRVLRRTEHDLRQQVAQKTDSLRSAKESAEQQNEAKTEFLARVNHELRNPLTAIVACSELLAKEAGLAEGERAEARATLEACTQNLLDSIDEVLDFTRIEAGEVELQLHDFALRDLVDAIARIVQARVEPGVDLVVRLEDGLPVLVNSDEAKLRQVLCNLGLNSARHTKAGMIELSCERVGERELRFVVADSGEGVDPALRGKIFERFATKTDPSGHGLGLYISRAFVEQLGGTIECATRDGGGDADGRARALRDRECASCARDRHRAAAASCAHPHRR